MATMNPFDLLGDDDNEDPLQLLAAQQQKLPTPASAAKKTPATAATAKLPSKPLPPSQTVREAKTEYQRGGRRGGPRGGGCGGRGRGFNQDFTNNENNYGSNNGFAGGYRPSEDGEGGKPFERRGGYGGGYRQSEDGEGGKPFERRGGYGGSYRQSEDGEGGKTFERRGGYGGGYRQSEDGEGGKTFERRGYGGPRGGFRGDRRGGLSNGENADGEYPRRVYERRSGTGRGNEVKREGSGRGNWGSSTDEIAPEAEVPMNGVAIDGVNTDAVEKQHGQEDAGDAKKHSPSEEPEVKEPEDKEMTLDEYEKLLEEKRKALLASKPEERKVCLDKEFKSMQLLANKKNDDEVFIKLGSEKEDSKKKETGEKVKKTKSINEFLKPAEGEMYYHRPGGRGRDRGRGRVGGRGYGGNNTSRSETPSIEDVGQFPTLGSK